VLKLSARNGFICVNHFPRFHLNLIHNGKGLDPKHFARHQLIRFGFRRGFLSLPAMRCPPDAGSSFLVIAVESFPRGIFSVDRDRFAISIARKSRDHGSPQSEKKHNPKKIKNQKNNGMRMVGVLGDDRCVLLSMHNRGSAAPDDQENQSAGSLHLRLLAGALLSMNRIPLTIIAPDFPEVCQLRFPPAA
jgi:hypothetical protein